MYKYVSGKSMANRAAALTEIWTFLSDTGWTLHDNQDGSSFRVYKSNGEQGDRIYEYALIDYATSNLIYFRGYYKWEAGVSSKTGSNLGATYYSTSSTYYVRVSTSESGFTMWMHGSKDLVVVHTKISSTYYNAGFGHVPKRFDDTICKLTSAASAGSDVDLEVDTVDGFVVGASYQLVGASHEGLQKVTVTDIIPDPYGAGIITVDSLGDDMSVDSLLGHSPSTFGTWHLFNNSAHTSHYIFPTINGYRTGLTNHTDPDERCTRSHMDLNSTTFLRTDPDYRTGNYIIMPTMFYVNDHISGSAAYQSWWAYDDTFMMTCEKLTSDDVLGLGVSIRSTATGAGVGSNTLADTGQSWTTNVYAGKVVITTGGTGDSQIRKIVSNTATELTLDKDWDTSIDGTTDYVIANEGYRYIYTFTAVREGY